jgi:hypothetical protein
MKITLTRKLAWAIATDEGNRYMRKGGRRAWDESDYNAPAKYLDKIYPKDLNGKR